MQRIPILLAGRLFRKLMNMSCPKCSYVRQPADQAPDWECPSCGIVYAKYKHPENEPEMVRDVIHTKEKQPMGFDSVTGISAIVTAALAIFKGMTTGVSMINGLLLVPFFFCLVPVLSVTFGDGLYQWNRWDMQFERYDSESHPLMARIIYILCIVFSLIFLALFFKLHK